MWLSAAFSLAMIAVVIALPESFVDERLLRLNKEPIRLRWLPDGRMLVLERLGRITIHNGSTSATYFEMPPSRLMNGVEYGLFDIALDPEFAETKEIYIYYSPRT
jgi:glucose/arabinose dehydrogenase